MFFGEKLFCPSNSQIEHFRRTFESENSIGWKRFSSLISLYLAFEKAAEERSYERFLVFSHAKKQVFFKNTQNQRAKLIFSKNDKNLLFNGGLFQQVLLT